MAFTASRPVRWTTLAFAAYALASPCLLGGTARAAASRIPAGASTRGTSSSPQSLPSQLLFIPTGNESINVYDLRDPNKKGPLAQITQGLAGNQFAMTVDGAGNLLVVNDNFTNSNEQYVGVYAPPYSGSPTILNGVVFPLGVAVDASGNVYVTNCGVYCSQTPAIYVYANGSTTPTSTITSSGFSSLGGMAFDRSGNLYVANSDRTTGASSIFEIAPGSTNPVQLKLDGLFNIGGPGIGSVAIDLNGNLHVGNNSNSTYLLTFKPGKPAAASIADPFAFFDIPAMIDAGPDGNIYVPINCGNQTCEGAVLGFHAKAGTPFETVGSANPGVGGVATYPNANLLGRRARGFVAEPSRGLFNLATEPRFARPSVAAPPAIRPLSGALQRPSTSAAIAARLFRTAHAPVRHSGGWLRPAAKSGKNLLYLSTSGNGQGLPAQVAIYSTKGQSQAPIGSITNGISGPQGMATDASGNLYVANSTGNTVTVYPPGQTAPSVTYTNGIGDPFDVKVGSDGTVYVANVLGNGSVSTVTEYPPGSTSPSATLQLGGMYALSVALDASNNLFVGWYNLSSATVEVYEYAPGSTSGTNLGLNLPAPSFPEYGMAFDHAGNLTMWYESFDHSVKYLAVFPPGTTEPQKPFLGGSLLSNVTGIAYPRSSKHIFVAAVNVNEGDELTYPRGIPLRVIGFDLASGIALSPGT